MFTVLNYRKDYCIEALRLVQKFDVQDYILIDWRDIMGVDVDELRDFNFTHIMTSAAVDKLFYLRVMQVAMHLKIPTLISRVSVQAVQKEYHVFHSHANEIEHVNLFCKAELQPESSGSKLENRNVAIVGTDLIGPAAIKRMNIAIVNEMKLLLINHYGYLDKTNRWIKKAFCDRWSSIFNTFSKTGDRNVFNADATNDSVIFQFEPLPHVVKSRLTITVDDIIIRYSENTDVFFSYVQEFFVDAFKHHHYFLLDSESIAQLDLGEIRDKAQLADNDGDERRRKRELNLAKKKRQLARKKQKVDDEKDEFQIDQLNDGYKDDNVEDDNQDDNIEEDNQDDNVKDDNEGDHVEGDYQDDNVKS